MKEKRRVRQVIAIVRRAPASEGATEEGWRRTAMVTGKGSRLVLVTCGSVAEARRIATPVVRKRLAACVNIVLGPIQSIYRWKGKVQNAREFLIVIKTTQKRLAELEKEVKHWHSYDVPEFLVISVAGGSREYLEWLEESLKG
jgi:periplasmic divalent cation tolerance protein